MGDYYVLEGFRYDARFPVAWATSHDETWHGGGRGCADEESQLHVYYQGGGPKNCGNCCEYGSRNGVFVHYCSNCARHHGDRHSADVPNYITDDAELWELVPYMAGVSFAQVGDSSFMCERNCDEAARYLPADEDEEESVSTQEEWDEEEVQEDLNGRSGR